MMHQFFMGDIIDRVLTAGSASETAFPVPVCLPHFWTSRVCSMKRHSFPCTVDVHSYVLVSVKRARLVPEL